MPAAPKVVPLPTTTVICVLETMVQDEASVPDAGALPIFAAVQDCDPGMKLDPETVKVEPTYAEVGLTLEKTGLKTMVKEVGDIAATVNGFVNVTCADTNPAAVPVPTVHLNDEELTHKRADATVPVLGG